MFISLGELLIVVVRCLSASQALLKSINDDVVEQAWKFLGLFSWSSWFDISLVLQVFVEGKIMVDDVIGTLATLSALIVRGNLAFL